MIDSKYLDFKLIERKSRTLVFAVVSKASGHRLGEIKWCRPWRQYCFEPGWKTVWSHDCLADIRVVLNRLTSDHKNKIEILKGQNGHP